MPETASPGPPTAGGADCLTERELEIIAALARGLGNEQIAEELYLSHRTVRNYVSRLYHKLGVENRVAAANWWAAHGPQQSTSREGSTPLEGQR